MALAVYVTLRSVHAELECLWKTFLSLPTGVLDATLAEELSQRLAGYEQAIEAALTNHAEQPSDTIAALRQIERTLTEEREALRRLDEAVTSPQSS